MSIVERPAGPGRQGTRRSGLNGPDSPARPTSLELADQGLADIPSRKDSPTAPRSSDAVPLHVLIPSRARHTASHSVESAAADPGHRKEERMKRICP
jgi:hypothetical protein